MNMWLEQVLAPKESLTSYGFREKIAPAQLNYCYLSCSFVFFTKQISHLLTTCAPPGIDCLVRAHSSSGLKNQVANLLPQTGILFYTTVLNHRQCKSLQDTFHSGIDRQYYQTKNPLVLLLSLESQVHHKYTFKKKSIRTPSVYVMIRITRFIILWNV